VTRPDVTGRACAALADRLIYAPRIKPISKGGTTDVSKNYQAHKHHLAYWRPLQLYDAASDTAEQHSLVLLNADERAARNASADEAVTRTLRIHTVAAAARSRRALRSLCCRAQRQLKLELKWLQEALSEHLNASRELHECAASST
jgi:hypothetical protein